MSPRAFAAAPPQGTIVSPQSAARDAITFSTAGGRGPEAGLDRLHVDPLADPHELPLAGKSRQCLVDCRSGSQVKESAWAQ